MAAPTAPIVIIEGLKLPDFGIQPEHITPNNVTIDSENYVIVRETSTEDNIAVVDMDEPTKLLFHGTFDDNRLMNLYTGSLALKGQFEGTTQAQQLFIWVSGEVVKTHEMAEQVVFWKWITPELLGFVTKTSVYHWSIKGGSTPALMFKRNGSLKNNQIIDYRRDPGEKWLALIGIAPGLSERRQLMKGSMQLFSVEKQKSHVCEAHAAAFAAINVPGKENASTLIVFLRAGQVTSKLHIIDPGAEQGDNPGFSKKQTSINLSAGDDFPVSVQVSDKYQLIYVITKLGLLFVYDLETAVRIYSVTISPHPILVTSEASLVGGFSAVNTKGQVLFGIVNEATIVPYVSRQLDNLELALNLAKRGNLPVAENLVIQRFEEYLAEKKYKEAAEFAADSPQGILRTPNTVAKFKDVVVQADQTLPLMQYFETLRTKGKLNAFESLELCRHLVNQKKTILLNDWVAQDKLECSEQIGDLAKTVDHSLAKKIYLKAAAVSKAVSACLEGGLMGQAVELHGEFVEHSKQVEMRQVVSDAVDGYIKNSEFVLAIELVMHALLETGPAYGDDFCVEQLRKFIKPKVLDEVVHKWVDESEFQMGLALTQLNVPGMGEHLLELRLYILRKERCLIRTGGEIVLIMETLNKKDKFQYAETYYTMGDFFWKRSMHERALELAKSGAKIANKRKDAQDLRRRLDGLIRQIKKEQQERAEAAKEIKIEEKEEETQEKEAEEASEKAAKEIKIEEKEEETEEKEAKEASDEAAKEEAHEACEEVAKEEAHEASEEAAKEAFDEHPQTSSSLNEPEKEKEQIFFNDYLGVIPSELEHPYFPTYVDEDEVFYYSEEFSLSEWFKRYKTKESRWILIKTRKKVRREILLVAQSVVNTVLDYIDSNGVGAEVGNKSSYMLTQDLQDHGSSRQARFRARLIPTNSNRAPPKPSSVIKELISLLKDLFGGFHSHEWDFKDLFKQLRLYPSIWLNSHSHWIRRYLRNHPSLWDSYTRSALLLNFHHVSVAEPDANSVISDVRVFAKTYFIPRKTIDAWFSRIPPNSVYEEVLKFGVKKEEELPTTTTPKNEKYKEGRVGDVAKYLRAVIHHYHEHEVSKGSQGLRETEVELSNMFPGFLTGIYASFCAKRFFIG